MSPHQTLLSLARHTRSKLRLRSRLKDLLGVPKLVPCSGMSERVLLREACPTIEEYHDVIVVPFSRTVLYHDDPGWGVYDSDGHLIDAAALRRGADQRLVGQSTRADNLPENAAAPDEDAEYVYGGPIIKHYGHFICSSLSRLWWVLKDGLDGRKVVFHGSLEFGEALTFPYMAACFDRLGLNESNAFVVTTPLRFRKLIVPAASFQEEAFATRAFQRLCHDIGRPFWETREVKDLPPVYLSKTKLREGVNRIANESVIVDLLQRHGVEVLFPETMTFAAQVRLFSQRRIVIGQVGSAFHTSIFAPPCSRMICLSPRPVFNSNSLLIDRLNGARAEYFTVRSGCELKFREDHFDTSAKLAEPARVARELLDMAYCS